jgi:GH24 family phage-related lysozyme (muramidase)
MSIKITYNPALPTYLTYAGNLIGIAEGNHPYLYNDTAHIATVGVGVNVVAHPDSLLQELGVLATDPKYLVLHSDLTGNNISKFNGDIVAWGAAKGKTINPGNLLTQAQVDHLFLVVSAKREAALNAAIPGVPQSKERAALLSLAYQGNPINNPGLVKAVKAGDRAAAWYAIRYTMPTVHTQKTGITTHVEARRYLESERFGLYDDPNKVGIEEAVNVYAEMSKPKLWDEAIDYDRLNNRKRGTQGYPGHPEYVQTLQEELNPAFKVINSEYARLISISYTDIYVSQTDHIGLVAATTPTSAKLGAKRLIVGQGHNEQITGLNGRDDILVARGANDTLIGGDQYNVMISDVDGVGGVVDQFIGGARNNVIFAQGSGNTFHIANSNPNGINVVYDGAGGNKYVFSSSTECVVEVNLQNRLCRHYRHL